jgi:hypothetical protein
MRLLGCLAFLALVASGWPIEWAEAAPVPAAPGARLSNADAVRRHLGLTPGYDALPGIGSLKIAVLDYGFEGVSGPRAYLPADTVVVEHYDPEFIRRGHLGDPQYRNGFAAHNAHGRNLAQIVWAVTGFHAQGPKFYLLNANGPTMFRRAVRYAMEAKVDVVLFGGTFEGGGNGDGRGPINDIVADALAADILWVNAAGNYGGRVYNGPVDVQSDGFLRLSGDGKGLRFRNLLDENTVTITLTWNDYRRHEDAGTQKDLDLYVEDWQGKRVGASELTQVSGDRAVRAGESRNPRERVVLTDLPADREHDYRIRVGARKGLFTATDQLRVLITSSREAFYDPNSDSPTPAVRFVDATGQGELYPPADNPLVLTVGDASPLCSHGPTADYRVKPDVMLADSRAMFSNGEVTVGASNAAAYFAGVVALMKAAEPSLRMRHLLWFAHYGPAETMPVYADGAPGTPSPGWSSRLPTAGGVRGQATMPQAFRRSYSFSNPSLAATTTRSARSRRVWKTPTREQLAAKVRSDR